MSLLKDFERAINGERHKYECRAIRKRPQHGGREIFDKEKTEKNLYATCYSSHLLIFPFSRGNTDKYGAGYGVIKEACTIEQWLLISKVFDLLNIKMCNWTIKRKRICTSCVHT